MTESAASTHGAPAAATGTERRTRWERLHPIRAGRLWRCIEHGTHHPVLVDLGRRKVCLTCNEWSVTGR